MPGALRPVPEERAARLLALLRPLHDSARRTARRLCQSWADGDDLFQEAVLRALDRLDDLREEARFRPWFYAVLLSVHRARARRHFWRRFLPLPPHHGDAPRPADLGPDAEDVAGRAARVAQALARLPPEQREALVLFECEGFTLEEVAAAQEASLSAVKTRLMRGRARLREHYQGLLVAEEGALQPALATRETRNG